MLLPPLSRPKLYISLLLKLNNKKLNKNIDKKSQNLKRVNKKQERAIKDKTRQTKVVKKNWIHPHSLPHMSNIF